VSYFARDEIAQIVTMCSPIEVGDARPIADRVIAAGFRKPRLVTTAMELEAVPRGVVLRSKAGTIAARFDALSGVVFGNERPFPWGVLDLPAVVLYDPTET